MNLSFAIGVVRRQPTDGLVLCGHARIDICGHEASRQLGAACVYDQTPLELSL